MYNVVMSVFYFKKAKQSGGNKKTGGKANVKSTPFLIRDGDFIGVKVSSCQSKVCMSLLLLCFDLTHLPPQRLSYGKTPSLDYRSFSLVDIPKLLVFRTCEKIHTIRTI